MDKILSKETNKLEIDVYINGQILLELIPKEVIINIVGELERDVANNFDKKTVKKNIKKLLTNNFSEDIIKL